LTRLFSFQRPGVYTLVDFFRNGLLSPLDLKLVNEGLDQ
jgi:hypothetical protein